MIFDAEIILNPILTDVEISGLELNETIEFNPIDFAIEVTFIAGLPGRDGNAILPDNIVIDPNYIHTDNNYSDADILEVAKIVDKQNSTDNTLQTEAQTIAAAINEVRTIAIGADIAYVFDTEIAMNAWLAIPENVSKLQAGNLFLIRETSVPDYWWDGVEALELEIKIDLTNYYTKSEIETNFRNETQSTIGALIEATELTEITDTTKIAASDSAFLKWFSGLRIKNYLTGFFAKLIGGNIFAGRQSVSTNGQTVNAGGVNGSHVDTTGFYTNGAYRAGNGILIQDSDIRAYYGSDAITIQGLGGKTNIEGLINHKAGEYFYSAASKTADTVNDTRVINSAGVEIHSICTVANETKGGGTWVEAYRVDSAGNFGIKNIPTYPTARLYVHGNSGSDPDLFRIFSGRNALGFIVANDGHARFTGNLKVDGTFEIPSLSLSSYFTFTRDFAVGKIFGWDGLTFSVLENEVFRLLRPGHISILNTAYIYNGASPTSDAINDTRTSNQSGVVIYERCTGNGATKGAGTWVVDMKILANGRKQFGDDANNVLIDTFGSVKLNGTATVFDDLSASSLTLQQTGPGISLNIQEACVEFTSSSNLSDYMVQSLQLRHTWKVGSVIYPHIHLIQKSAAIPNMLIQYRWQQNGGAIVTSWTNYKSNTPVFTYTSGSLNQILHDGGITPPVGASLSDIVEFRIIRDNANTSGLFSGADAVTGVVQVKSFDIHFESDQLGGSNLEYAK